VTVAFYGFQLVPDVRVVTSDTGWSGWFDEWAGPLIDAGFREHHLHNPFGLHDMPGRDRVMHIDQFELSYCRRLAWLANRAAFADAVKRVHDRGGVVQAYVGSPLVIGSRPQPEYLPGSSPGADRFSSQLRWLDRLGLCRLPPPFGRCPCWRRIVGFHIAPLLEAGVDAIGFDDSASFRPGDCMDQLVRWLLGRRMEVMIEDWPWADRAYPPVSWVVRELRYHQIRLGVVTGKADVATVVRKVYRIVPALHGQAGEDEFDAINELKRDHGESEFPSVHALVESVREAGHTPMIRARDLESGEIA
jgi:hypothetical protein